MTDIRDPWLSAEQRIPYIVAPIRLPTSISFDTFYERVLGTFDRLHGIYSGHFFKINHGMQIILGIRNKRAALINIWSEVHQVDLDNPASNPVTAPIAIALKELNCLFGCEKGTMIEIEGLKQEVSARQFN